MKPFLFTLLVLLQTLLARDAAASFSGSTYTLDGPYSLCVTNASFIISNIVATTYNVGTLIVSNSAPKPITVYWAAPGHAVGVGTTNQLQLLSGEVAEIKVNAVFPGLVIYSTGQEQILPDIAFNNDIIPELLYYKMTEGAQSYQIGSRYFENPPVYLADSSQLGGATGTVTAVSVPVEWVPNQNATPYSAIHFNGASTALTAGNAARFSFTTNLFTINIWVRNLTYPCAIVGNGIYANAGWYLVINTAGAVVMAAENPGSDNYVATTSTVAFVGDWAMITVVRTNTNTILIYRNAVLQTTTGAFTDPAPCNNNLILGDNYSGNQYDGDLGTIRIYDRPLSTNEINTLYLNDTTQ